MARPTRLARPLSSPGRPKPTLTRLLAVLLLLLPGMGLARGDTLTIGAAPPLTRAALLDRFNPIEIELPADPAYGPGPRRFLAIPLAPLARAAEVTADATLLARAGDGYVAQIPGGIALREEEGKPRGWLAVQRAGETWPTIPGKSFSAAPYYIVWQDPDSSVISRYWVYNLAALAAARTPSERWPQLRVAASLPADAPERRGETLFAAACLTCHRLNGAGDANIGPDLNRPMNPTEYWKREPLLKFIRNPASVRSWPGSQMPATLPATLSDADIELVVRYLEHKAAQKAN